jgi:hypothetical protein
MLIAAPSLRHQSSHAGRVKPYLPERPLKTRSQFVQLTRVVTGQPAQKLPALVRDMQNGPAFVAGVGLARQKALAYRAVNEFDRAVVLQSKAFGGIRDGHGCPLGCAGHLEEELVLLGLQSYLKSSAFAEKQESAQFVSKVGQGPEKRVRSAGGRIHKYIVTRYIVNCKLAFNVFVDPDE